MKSSNKLNKFKKHSTQIVLCTTSNIKEAKKITKKLLNKKLSACITLIPNVLSYYYWKNKIEKTKEIQMIIKTKSSLKNRVFLQIKKYNSYETPELIAIQIEDIDQSYLNWMNKIIN